MAGTAAVLACLVIPNLGSSGALITVVSSPSPQEPDSPQPNESPPITRPLPPPPVSHSSIAQPPAPSKPILPTPATLALTDILAQSEEALLAIEVFQEEETQRQKDILQKEKEREQAAAEAALIEQQKAEEKEVERKRQEEARRAIAQKKAQKKAATAQANQVRSTPTIAHRTPPVYPSSARRNKEQGTAQITFTVTSSGRVSSPRVVASSGHRSLDSSALAAVKKWHFNPAKNGLGQPVAFQIAVPVTFRLK